MAAFRRTVERKQERWYIGYMLALMLTISCR